MNLRIFLIIILIVYSSISTIAQTVYTTKTGEKYHKETCRYLKYSKKEIDLKKAVEFGYQACKVCKPSSKVTKVQTNSINSNKSSSSKKRSFAVQCSGKTKSGRRCRRKTKSSNGRCYQH
ncbi:hypothetical protein [Tenacibaculum mesophilum]|uniref:hypothetical protein n=1 Tax=Tenacibaculum mesophilum TaxID=104268 RepID=UPI002493BF70|nr:hypothetical protein [Tenacibaculum mesophilum]